MQDIFPPVSNQKFWKNKRQRVPRMTFTDGIYIGQHWTDQGTVRRLNDEELDILLVWYLLLPRIPGHLHVIHLVFAGSDMYGRHMRGEGASLGQALD